MPTSLCLEPKRARFVGPFSLGTSAKKCLPFQGRLVGNPSSMARNSASSGYRVIR